MKPYRHPDFTIASNERCIAFFERFFADSGEFVKQLAPEGFIHSAYHGMYHSTAEKDYKRYRRNMLRSYKLAKFYGGQPETAPYISFNEFEKSYQESPVHPEKEVLVLRCTGLMDIFGHNPIVHNGQGESYKRDNDFVLQDCMLRGMQYHEQEGITYSRKEIFDIEPYENPGLQPVYRFIFQKMKAAGLDYRYDHLPREVLASLLAPLHSLLEEAEREKLLAKPDPGAAILAEISRDWVKEDQKEIDLLVKQAEGLAPSPIINAYFDVYGKWPKGYPPDN